MIIKNFYIKNESFDIINIVSVEPKDDYPRISFMISSSNLDRLKSSLTDEQYIYDLLYQYGIKINFDLKSKNTNNCWWYIDKAEYNLDIKPGSSFFNLTVISKDKINGDSILRDRKLDIIMNK